jgi:hypothetical protein
MLRWLRHWWRGSRSFCRRRRCWRFGRRRRWRGGLRWLLGLTEEPQADVEHIEEPKAEPARRCAGFDRNDERE